ncbi:xanthine dehydrogenase accessory protein XdhC [Rhodovulum steppense]|uniref:Xanthine dehydrogenase accessory factor n=1 Tax=Rhodovulum steppense TaxID=540251 RepID=A0A4R1YSJ3_9RHOB|nr:xanthine dehydrogenase accessory protein XdhC [Rhodovulum steppense]TCM82610.1 xanthine dehydrogenase accessory factor [Rhodovulum steppense]
MAEASGFLSAHPDAVLVRLEGVQGSAPREAGAWMLVTAGACFGTIGGGRLEFDAIAAARAMLAAGEAARRIEVALGPETGQCCGGRVVVALTRLDVAGRAALLAAEHAAADARPHVLILGAGHVGRALAGLLVQMPVRTLLIDSRADQVAQAPPGVEARLTPLPEAEIRAAPPGAAHVVLTHDHGLDFLLVAEALARDDAAYVGMIGSASKRARLLRFLAERGVAHRGLTCPIGAAGAGDKRPAVIAAFVLAEIMAALGARAAEAACIAADI